MLRVTVQPMLYEMVINFYGSVPSIDTEDM